MNKVKLSILILIYVFFCGFIFGNDSVDESDSKSAIKFVKKNVKLYEKEPLKIKNGKKRMALIKKKAELEKYALKIDAGDIKNKRLRMKIIALRRKAMKNRNSSNFVINNFDNSANNKLAGDVGCIYKGKVNELSPWLRYEKVNEDGRIGKKDFKFFYNIEDGEVFFFNEVKKISIIKKYDGILIRIRGDIKAIKIRLRFKDNSTMSYIINDIDSVWKKFVVPFRNFFGNDIVDLSELRRIEFVVDDSMTDNFSGQFQLNQFMLVKSLIDDKKKNKLSFTYEVEGAVPLGTDTSLFYK